MAQELLVNKDIGFYKRNSRSEPLHADVPPETEKRIDISVPHIYELGKSYSRNYISKQTGGDVLHYLPHVKGKVVCATLRPEMNPDAPNVITVTNNKVVIHWARVFASQKNFVPVFIRHAKNMWKYVGDFRVKKVVEEFESLKRYEIELSTPLTMLLFLEPRDR